MNLINLTPNMSAIPDWLLPTILLFPALLWMFLCVGVPWALAVIPRGDWRNRVTVIACALALGPALTTATMFIIGTFGHFSALNVLGASVLVAAIGAVFALRNHATNANSIVHSPLTVIDITLIVVIVAVLVLRFWNTAYWPYTTYDEFWVYGYNAKIFMLRGAIPPTMGYYPQLIPLAYTYWQLLWC